MYLVCLGKKHGMKDEPTSNVFCVSLIIDAIHFAEATITDRMDFLITVKPGLQTSRLSPLLKNNISCVEKVTST